MKRQEIFKPGTWTDMHGKKLTFSEADIQATLNAYDPALFRAPLVVGHPKTNDPAYGWVESLDREGDILRAVPEQVDPEFAEIEKECAGTIDAITTAARPILWEGHQRDYLRHRRELNALFVRELSPEEAHEAAEFYTSELGQRMILSAVENADVSQSVAAALADEDAPINERTFQADK